MNVVYHTESLSLLAFNSFVLLGGYIITSIFQYTEFFRGGGIECPNGSLGKVRTLSKLPAVCDVLTNCDVNLDEPCVSLLAPSIEFTQTDSS